MIFEIKPDYRLRNFIRYAFFAIGFVFILVTIFNHDRGYLFLAIISIAIGGFISIFSSKKHLTINDKSIILKTKNLIDESDSVSIDFSNIERVDFCNRQMLFLGGRNPLADADAQTMYNENRIIFTLKDNSQKVIMQVGKIEDFKNAFTLIKDKVNLTNNRDKL